MGLFQLLAIVGVFMSGLLLGTMVWYAWPVLPLSIAQVLGGITSVLTLTSVVYDFLDWLPEPPPCPRCGDREYSRAADDTARWSCVRCQQSIVLRGDGIAVLDETGETCMYLELRWPRFLGMWRPKRSR